MSLPLVSAGLRRLAVLVALVLLVGCGRSTPTKPNPSELERLEERVVQVLEWAPVCKNGMASKQSCDDGDNLLWSGLLCLSGEESQCRFVKESVDTDGRAWRSPYRVGKDRANSFSRDMAVGLLAYVARTKDFATLDRWVNYYEAEGKLCPDAVDNRCELSPNIRSLAKIVKGDKSEVDSYLTILYAQAKFGETGYPMHLVASQLVILKHLGLGNRYLWNQTAQALNTRDINPLFMYLDGEEDKAVRTALERIPQAKPTKQSQWSIERHHSEAAWKRSMGWEWVYLLNLIKE